VTRRGCLNNEPKVVVSIQALEWKGWDETDEDNKKLCRLVQAEPVSVEGNLGNQYVRIGFLELPDASLHIVGAEVIGFVDEGRVEEIAGSSSRLISPSFT